MTTLALVGLAVISIVVFFFVLEPILRAKGDRVVLDAAALPRTPDPRDIDTGDDDMPGMVDDESIEQPTQDPPAIAARRVGSDAV